MITLLLIPTVAFRKARTSRHWTRKPRFHAISAYITNKLFCFNLMRHLGSPCFRRVGRIQASRVCSASRLSCNIFCRVLPRRNSCRLHVPHLRFSHVIYLWPNQPRGVGVDRRRLRAHAQCCCLSLHSLQVRVAVSVPVRCCCSRQRAVQPMAT